MAQLFKVFWFDQIFYKWKW